MTPPDLTGLLDWFTTFCESYTKNATGDDLRNYLLKQEHTHRVRQAALAIATEQGCNSADLLLAESIGLLHDVGRFPQYREFRTFRDADSVNHAARSVRVMVENRLLAGLAQEDRQLIIKSVALHNVYLIPEQLSPRELCFLRLIRDADKLDIWQVFLEYYDLPHDQRASAVGLGFPDVPGCSPRVLETLRQGRMINLTTVNSLNDFKLLQLSWIFDLNFATTRRLFVERNYLARFAATLPDDPEVRSLLEFLETGLIDHQTPVAVMGQE
jgi:HD domain